ncbi:isoprenylcysteine carboxylmethyltransferase family protein [Patescibacteria group bacterium]|nr:MAG: isoprenylcysteine carboxylmethyltransferase family protein [Patescibacteria group bacterium]
MVVIRYILIVAVIIFYAIRLRSSVLRRAAKNKVSLPLFVGELFIVLLVVVQLSDHDPLKFQIPLWINYFGLGLGLAGAAFASVARITLRKNYVPATAAGAPESVTTSGVYRLVRHPSYLGTLLGFFGFELALSSYFILIVLIVTVIIFRQIEKEEKIMLVAHEQEWKAFTQKTHYKLIPFVY